MSKKNRKSKIINHKSPLTEAAAQRLGYTCRDIAEADAASGIGPNLSKYFERHPRLRKAFDRGRLLRSLVELAPNAVVYEASRRLKDLGFTQFESAQDLANFLQADREAYELWESARVNGFIANRENMRKSAEAGNVRAIQLLDKWAVDRQKETGEAGSANFNRVGVNQMAELFGVERQTIYEWYKDKGLPQNTDGTFDLQRAIPWYKEFTLKKAVRPKESIGDKLRDLKAERMEIELSQQRGQLVDRDEVFNGLAQRLRNLIKEFDAKKNQIARLLHGQTVERIADILEHFFEDDLLASQLKLPECIELPEGAMAKLADCLSLCAKATESLATEHTEDTEI